MTRIAEEVSLSFVAGFSLSISIYRAIVRVTRDTGERNRDALSRTSMSKKTHTRRKGANFVSRKD